MLAAKNADICSKCLVTEPSVRSFILLQSVWRRRRKLVCVASHEVKLVTDCCSNPSASFPFSDHCYLATYHLVADALAVHARLLRCDPSGCMPEQAGKNLEGANSHAIAGAGTGGGIPADMRFRQATRWRMRKI